MICNYSHLYPIILKYVEYATEDEQSLRFCRNWVRVFIINTIKIAYR